MSRRSLWAALAAAALMASCSPAPPDRATPDDAANPTFLAVTNDALGPLVLGSTAGTFASRDAGREWSPVAPEQRGATAMAATGDTVILSLGTQLILYDLAVDRAMSKPGPWPGGRNVIAMAAAPGQHMVWALAAGSEPRLLRSTDDARTWTPVVPSGLCRRPRALAAASPPGQRLRLYAACGPAGLLVSTDFGLSFHRVHGIDTARDVATCLSDPYMVVVASPLVRVSHDGGGTWRDGLLVAERVAIDPRNPDLVFAIAPNDRLFVSKDGGRSF